MRAFPRLRGATLSIDFETPSSARAGAYSLPDTLAVFLYARTLRWSRGRIVALLRHELAHVARPSLSEAAVDKLAERVGGAPIWYDRVDVQTVERVSGAKRPRPSYLQR